MTVTTPSAELEAAAAREASLGNHAYAASLYKEANENQSISVTTTIASHKATIVTSIATEVGASHVKKVHGEDGSVHSAGAVT